MVTWKKPETAAEIVVPASASVYASALALPPVESSSAVATGAIVAVKQSTATDAIVAVKPSTSTTKPVDQEEIEAVGVKKNLISFKILD